MKNKLLLMTISLLSLNAYAKNISGQDALQELQKRIRIGEYQGTESNGRSCTVSFEVDKNYFSLNVQGSDGLSAEINLSTTDQANTSTSAKGKLSVWTVEEDGDEVHGAYTITDRVEITTGKTLKVLASHENSVFGKDSYTCEIALNKNVSLTESWRLKGLKNPESVVYDSKRDLLYVSLMNNSGNPKSASIGKLSLDGKVIDQDWITGLNSPKGLALSKDGNTLYVSDVTELVAIDIKTGKLTTYTDQTHKPKFLNDVVLSPNGTDIYVSDMFNSSIYKLDSKGNFTLWLESPSLENPNGLLVNKWDSLWIAAWGPFTNESPISAPKGNLIQVSLTDQSVTQVSQSAIGNLDGIQWLNDNELILSDWIEGKIFISHADNTVTEVLDLDQSAGDIAYLKDQKLLLVPMAKQGEVIAYLLK